MTPYQVLGVPVDATEEAIKHAYRTLARECHPDFHPGDPVKEARFKALGAAYFTLGDPTRRHTYDHPPVPDLLVKTKRHEYRAGKLYAVGDLADLYLATAEDGATVLLKIARHERVNDLLEAEAAMARPDFERLLVSAAQAPITLRSFGPTAEHKAFSVDSVAAVAALH